VDAQEHWLVAGTASGDVVVTDLLSGKGCYRLKHSEAPNVPGARYDGVTHAKFLGNGSAIVSACSNGVVSVWDLPTDDASYNSREADATNRRSYFGGNRQATAAQSSSKRLLSTMKVHSAPVTAMICESAADIDLDDLDVDTSATSWFICSGDAKGGVVITQGSKDATAGVTTATPTPMSPMASLGQMAGASAAGTSAAVRNKSTPLQINAKSAVSCLTFASSTGPLPPPSSAAPTTKGKSADMMAGSKQSSFRNPQEEVAAFEPTSKALDFLAIGSQSGVVEVFDLASSQSVYHIKGHQSKVTSITPRRSFELVSCSTDRTIKLWDLRTKSSGLYIGERYLEERVIGIDEIRKSAYAPITSITIGGIDNSLIVSCAADGDIRVWDLRYDFTRPCQMLRGHTNAVTSVHWSVADNRLRSGSLDGSLRYWDTLDGRCTQTLPVFSHVGIASAVSTTSTASNLSREWVATLSVNGALKVFKTRQNQRRNSRNSISDTR
jgi:WD40 repeat protein